MTHQVHDPRAWTDHDAYEVFRQSMARLFPLGGANPVLEKERVLILELINKLRIEHSQVRHNYYRIDRSRGLFNPLNVDHLSRLIAYLSYELYNQNYDEGILDELFFVQRTHCSLNLFYKTRMEEYFFPFHALGTVLGRTNYGKNFFVHQGCTIGGNLYEFPTIGNGVVISPGVTVLGKCKIGDNVLVGANTLIIEKDIPDNTIVFGQPGNYRLRANEKDNKNIWLD